MAELFNVYLDESCHLENDSIQVMGLGAAWCPQDKVQEISKRVREIKVKHGLSPHFEMKWKKVSPAQLDFYHSVLDYFLDDDDLRFRGLVIPDKSKLDHSAFSQTHDDWYYKMCFTLLKAIVDPENNYSIYLDIKDTRCEPKRQKLEDVLRESHYDGSKEIIRRVQQIRSHESELMQLTDLVLGVVVYANRNLSTSTAKLSLVARLRKRTRFSLTRSTWPLEPKVNLLVWESSQP